MREEETLPHKLSLEERKCLRLSGVTEVISFDEACVALRTTLGDLTVHGEGLRLKNLSLEGGQAAVEGTITALIYEQPRRGGLRRLLG